MLATLLSAVHVAGHSPELLLETLPHHCQLTLLENKLSNPSSLLPPKRDTGAAAAGALASSSRLRFPALSLPIVVYRVVDVKGGGWLKISEVIQLSAPGLRNAEISRICDLRIQDFGSRPTS